MKRIVALLVMVGMLSPMLATTVNSAPDSGSIAVQATIQSGTPDAGFVIYKQLGGATEPDWTTKYTSMNFNRFTIVQRGTQPAQWTSVDSFVVVAYANGLGRQYKIQASGSGTFTLTGGTATLPNGCFVRTPWYAPEDMWDGNNDGDTSDPEDFAQGAKPTAATLGVAGNANTGALTTFADVYTSESPGSSRIIRTYFSFAPYKADGTPPYTTGYLPIPSSQLSGTYTGGTVKLRIYPVA